MRLHFLSCSLPLIVPPSARPPPPLSSVWSFTANFSLSPWPFVLIPSVVAEAELLLLGPQDTLCFRSQFSPTQLSSGASRSVWDPAWQLLPSSPALILVLLAQTGHLCIRSQWAPAFYHNQDCHFCCHFSCTLPFHQHAYCLRQKRLGDSPQLGRVKTWARTPVTWCQVQWHCLLPRWLCFLSLKKRVLNSDKCKFNSSSGPCYN